MGSWAEVLCVLVCCGSWTEVLCSCVLWFLDRSVVCKKNTCGDTDLLLA
jgi:hypothetical protein